MRRDATQQFPEQNRTELLSLEQKMDISEQMYVTLRDKIIERYGTPMVMQATSERLKFTISWFPKRGGRQVSLSVSVNQLGGLCVEFSRSTVQGISNKSDKIENGLVIKMHEGTHISLVTDPDKSDLQVNLYPGKLYHATKKMQQIAMDLVDTILMA